jgi:ankyrin repeat protein
VSAQVDALVSAANNGDTATLSKLLEAQPALASAERQTRAGLERCPALCRAAAMGHVEAVRLLLRHGANPNAMYRDGYGTALTAACECLAPGAGDVVGLLLDAGADPIEADALFMACSTYARNPAEKHRVVRLLMNTGETADQHAAVLAVHAGDAKLLTGCLARDPGLISKRFPEVEYLNWPLHLGAPTLLHIAADMGEAPLVQLLLAAGADVNVRAGPGEMGCGYQTPVFHCLTSQNASGLEVLRLLVSRNADLGVTAKVCFPDEATGVCAGAGTVADLKPLGLALRFEAAPPSRNSAEAVRLLRDAGAVE